MLLKEYDRILENGDRTKVTINLEAVDVISLHQNASVEKYKDTCVVVMRCGMVMHLAAKKESIEACMRPYKG